MVKIAVAGGSGQVGREVVDTIIGAKQHEVVVLSRNTKPGVGDDSSGTIWRTVNYHDMSQLIATLKDVHTLLSFTQLMTDPENVVQKNLIDAAIAAGVTRFAPSEWGSSSTIGMPWWAGKDKIKEYLAEVNKEKKTTPVLEYTLFQPGLFLDYLATPYKTAKYLEPLNTMIDFQHRRAIVVDGHDAVMTFTTVSDLAAVVAKAVNLPGEWPKVSGISGNRVSISQILRIGENVRGCAFTVDRVTIEDLERGILSASWKLQTSHPSVAEKMDEMLKTVLVGTLISSVRGAWDVSDEMNRLLPDLQFTEVEEFLTKVWKEKP